MATSSVPSRRLFPGRLLLVLGLVAPFVGIAAYVGQVYAKYLVTPWYMPVVATLGVVLVGAAMWKKCNVWRVLALIFVVALAGVQWAFMFAYLPEYEGPVAVGQPFPVFETSRADGTPFTQRDLRGGQNTVMVFFRGRW